MKKLLAIGCMLGVLAFLLRPGDGTNTAAGTGDPPDSPALPAGPIRAPAAQAQEALAPAAEAPPLGESEKRSVRGLMAVLARCPSIRKPGELFREMARLGLRPAVTRSSNPDTGALLMVRSENALPGTRYFHAQVFGDLGEAAHTQHFSFEIRPGADSMEFAKEQVRAAYPGLEEPLVEREDYVLWRTGQGRVVSVKRLRREDLQESVFNARAPEDVGTIWVVGEDEPMHGQEEPVASGGHEG